MTPAARAAAAIEILDDIIAGHPAEPRLIRWARSSRYAGSGDRAAVRDLVYDSLRQRRSRAALGGAESGRGLILGGCRIAGSEPDLIFTGAHHAPEPLTDSERSAGRQPTAAEATDLPDWWAEHLARDLGDRFDAVAAALRERAPVWLRANLAATDAEAARRALASDGVMVEPDARCPTALRATAGARRIQSSAAWRDGLIELQDLSPQIACEALQVGPGQAVLDYCAGGGGKSLALAARGADVTAWDVSAARMSDLPERARRAGTTIRIAGTNPPAGPFELVVADVPCSGSGTWRRTPDAKWKMTPDHVGRLLETQALIMDDAAGRVGKSGRLAYMTCSLLRAENEDQTTAFLDRHADFRLDQSMRLDPLSASDGFFVAIFSR